MACKPQFLRGQHPLGKSVHNRMPVGSASILVVEPMGKPTFPPGKPTGKTWENQQTLRATYGSMDWFKTNLNQKAWLFTSKFAMVLSAGFTPCPTSGTLFWGLLDSHVGLLDSHMNHPKSLLITVNDYESPLNHCSLMTINDYKSLFIIPTIYKHCH